MFKLCVALTACLAVAAAKPYFPISYSAYPVPANPSYVGYAPVAPVATYSAYSPTVYSAAPAVAVAPAVAAAPAVATAPIAPAAAFATPVVSTYSVPAYSTYLIKK